MKKLISLFLALVMVFSLAVPVMAAEDTITLYFENTEGWSEVYAYVWNDDGDAPFGYWPGTAMTLVDGETSIYSVEVSTEAVYVVFNKNAGGQTADQTIPTNGTNLYTYSTGEWSTYTPAASGDTNGGITGNTTGDVTANFDPNIAITGISITGETVIYDADTKTYIVFVPVGGSVDDMSIVLEGTNLKYIPADDETYLLRWSYVYEGVSFINDYYLGEDIDDGYCQVVDDMLVEEWTALCEQIGVPFEFSFSNDGGKTWSEPIHYVVKEALDIDASITGIRVTGDTVTYDAATNTYTVGVPVDTGSVGATLMFEGTNLEDIPENSYTYLVRAYTPGIEDSSESILAFGQLATMWAFDDTGALSHTFNYGTSLVGTIGAYAYSNNGVAGWSDPVYIAWENAYPINVDTSIENGTVSAKSYAVEGETVELFVNADDGYELDELTVTDGEGNGVTVNEDHTFVMPASAVTVNATFKEAATAYTITVDDAIAGGTVTVNGGMTSAHAGDDIILTVAPNEGYKLVNVTVNDGAVEVHQVQGESNQYTFTMPAANVTVTATYTLVEAKWGTSADSLTESGTFAEALAAAAADSTVAYIQLQTNVTTESSNYITSGVFTLDLNGKTLSSSEYTISVRNAGTVVTLTDSASGGAVTTSHEGCSAVAAKFGAKVVINGASYSGGRGVVISESGSGEINSGTFNATAGAAVEAESGGTLTIIDGTFHTTDNYAVAASSGGTLTITGGTFTGTWAAVHSQGTTTITGGTFHAGSDGHIAYWNGKLDLSGYDANGLTLSQWTDADLAVSSENILLPVGSTFLDADGKAVTTLANGIVYTIGVETVEATYTVDIYETSNGTVIANRETAAAGETVILTMTPENGYALYALYIDGEEVAVTGNTYTFQMPEADVSVTAIFELSGKALEKLYFKNTGNWERIYVYFYTSSGWSLDHGAVDLTLEGGETDIYATTDIPEFAYKAYFILDDGEGPVMETEVMDLPTDGILNQYNPDTETWTTFVATEQPTVSADIVWGSMAFTYTDESGWANDATEGGTVTVTNTGDSTITAKVAYNALDSYSEITGSFDVESATLVTDASQTFKLTLSNKPEKAIPAGTKIGSVTVTIE